MSINQIAKREKRIEIAGNNFLKNNFKLSSLVVYTNSPFSFTKKGDLIYYIFFK